jgi:Protein of unknown function (DUF2971)
VELERDNYFFHYTTSGAAFEHILPEARLRLSRYFDMRDPLENKEWWFSAGGRGADTDDEDEHRAREWFVFNRAANRVRRRSFLLSLTIDTPNGETDEEEPFCRGWARGRMWEQYAENNAGVCLVFDRERLTDAVLASLQNQEFGALYHQAVAYEGAGILKPMLDIEALGREVAAEQVSSFIQDHYEPLFFHKVLDWQSEHEYRFCTVGQDGDQVFADIGNALYAVIVGERFPDWQRPAAIEGCTAVGARPLRLDWSLGEPSLRPLRRLQRQPGLTLERIEDPGAGPPAAPRLGRSS